VCTIWKRIDSNIKQVVPKHFQKLLAGLRDRF
jgi:hypothetical protein